jgi:hypothetical protein
MAVKEKQAIFGINKNQAITRTEGTMIRGGDCRCPEQDKPGIDQSTTTTDRGKFIQRIQTKGNISLDNWAEVFRCFIAPAVRINLKRLRLGIDFDLESHADHGLDENDPASKAMKEAARQLGVELKEEYLEEG